MLAASAVSPIRTATSSRRRRPIIRTRVLATDVRPGGSTRRRARSIDHVMAPRLRLLSSDRPRDGEAGFALVEVIVSAAVLAMVALAVLAGVDAAGRSSGREKARAVAVSLAEQDQERLRGIPAKAVTTIDSPSPVTLNGATYTITSKAEYIDDAT